MPATQASARFWFRCPSGRTQSRTGFRTGIANGSFLDASVSPTFLASAGWNWLPIVRGRNVGIWNDVSLSTTGDVRIVDPWVVIRVLLNEDPDGWSAVTLRLPGADLIIVNSAHSQARQNSNLMHELAHILLGHTPTRVDVTEDQHLLLRTHDGEQEEEASWFSGCLLLPRPALLAIVRAGRGDAARRYGVSSDMLTYRIRVAGVEVQARRASRFVD